MKHQETGNTLTHRRRTLEAAAWTVPVLAAATSSALSSVSVDLVASMDGLVTFDWNFGTHGSWGYEAPTSITITNRGTATTAGDEIVVVTYPTDLVNVTISIVGVGLSTNSHGTAAVTGLDLDPGQSLTIKLDVTAALSSTTALRVLSALGGIAPTITVTVSDGDVRHDTVTSRPIGLHLGN